MNTIDLERRKPSDADPRRLEYAGQRTAQEIFQELKYCLESAGYLPDEYFLMDMEWENGREIPRGADIFCTTDYGESEGIYLDVYLKWYDNGKPITKNFITGKTLGESGSDLDRMFLISSAITKAFHGDGAAHARYMQVGGVKDDSGGAVLHLSQQEQRVIVEALVEQRERQENAMSQTEQLLRRMTGSITEYINEVGMRPLRMSDYDKAVLAIHDGELSAFKELYPKALDRADELLIESAGRPGSVGCKMTLLLMVDAEQFSEEAYRAACQRAIDISDSEKVKFLMEQAGHHVEGLNMSFYGDMACYACSEHRAIAKEIINRCTPEQISAARPELIQPFASDGDFRTMSELVDKGISGGPSAWRTLHMLTYESRNRWMAEQLLQKRMWVSSDDYEALHACIKNDAVGVAKRLLDGGMDLDEYRQWAQTRQCSGHEETINTLSDYWQELSAPTGPQMGGPVLG
ncbi:MAG: ankyrin repeat domain-containing protein [Butyricicoccus sp.]|nr:ankyrin repeat domain-containing protein [Butyricicoccus sp.]